MFQPAVVAPLLEAIRSRTGAAGVYFYRFDVEEGAARLTGWAGREPAAAFDAIADPALSEHLRRESPIVLHRSAWSDRRFAVFPEIRLAGIEGLISVPLIHDGVPVGLLNLCHAEAASFPASEVAAVFGLSLPMGALLAAGIEFAKLSEQLADRKILERAKGILQTRLAWTEEQAYLHLRRTSRRRRTPMRDIAREVIEDASAVDAWEARRAS